MHKLLLVLLAVGAVSADLPRVLSALELLQFRLDNDFKFAQVHALMDLDNIVQDTEKGIAAIIKNPVRGTKELLANLKNDLHKSLEWAKEDYLTVRSHIKEAIETIKEELKPTERPVTSTTSINK